MFLDLCGKQDLVKEETNVEVFTRVSSDRVRPAMWHLGKRFYFKPDEPLSIHFSYLEFLDYMIYNYEEFINKDIVHLYKSGEIQMDDTRLRVFKVLYKSYKEKPKSFKYASEVVYRFKVEAEFETYVPNDLNHDNIPSVYGDGLTLYDGPSEVEMVLKSGAIVLNESGDSLSLEDVRPNYTKRFLDKFGPYYKKILEKYPIECYEKYACFCWSMSNGYDISKFIDFKFSDDQVSGWSACLKLLNQDITFFNLLRYDSIDSYVANRLVALYELYGFNPTDYLKYGDCSTYKIVEQLLFNGYDTSVLNPSVVPNRFIFMIPICMELGVNFFELFSRFKIYTLHAGCCIALGLPMSSLEGKAFSASEWESIVVQAYEIVHHDTLSFDDILSTLCEDNVFNYDRLISCPTNDLFLRSLRKIK